MYIDTIKIGTFVYALELKLALNYIWLFVLNFLKEYLTILCNKLNKKIVSQWISKLSKLLFVWLCVISNLSFCLLVSFALSLFASVLWTKWSCFYTKHLSWFGTSFDFTVLTLNVVFFYIKELWFCYIADFLSNFLSAGLWPYLLVTSLRSGSLSLFFNVNFFSVWQ